MSVCGTFIFNSLVTSVSLCVFFFSFSFLLFFFIRRNHFEHEIHDCLSVSHAVNDQSFPLEFLFTRFFPVCVGFSLQINSRNRQRKGKKKRVANLPHCDVHFFSISFVPQTAPNGYQTYYLMKRTLNGSQIEWDNIDNWMHKNRSQNEEMKLRKIYLQSTRTTRMSSNWNALDDDDNGSSQWEHDEMANGEERRLKKWIKKRNKKKNTNEKSFIAKGNSNDESGTKYKWRRKRWRKKKNVRLCSVERNYSLSNLFDRMSRLTCRMH